MNNKNKTKWLVTLTFGVLMAVPTMISYAGVTGKKAVAFGAMNATGPGVKSGDGVEQKQQNHVLQGIAVDVSYDVTRFHCQLGQEILLWWKDLQEIQRPHKVEQSQKICTIK